MVVLDANRSDKRTLLLSHKRLLCSFALWFCCSHAKTYLVGDTENDSVNHGSSSGVLALGTVKASMKTPLEGLQTKSLC